MSGGGGGGGRKGGEVALVSTVLVGYAVIIRIFT